MRPTARPPATEAPGYLEYLRARPDELAATIESTPFAYVPFGALEWHGEHNVLGVDGLKAEALCRRVADRTGGVLFPCVHWGAFATMKFPYTFHSSKRALRKVTKAMVKDLYAMGFRLVVLLTGHYPASQVKNVRRAARKFAKKPGAFGIGIPEQALATDLGYVGDHAAKWETALMLALYPDLVDLSRAPAGLSYIDRLTRHGIWGFDPAEHATRELGVRVVETIVERLAKAVTTAWTEQTQAPFEAIHETFKRALKRQLTPTGALEIAGMDEKRDIWRLAKWLTFGRKKPRD